MKPIVLKIGGSSLFSDIPLRKLITSVGECFADQAILLIVGGGELVESMRQIHELRSDLDCKRMHWRCIGLLESTLDIAAELTPDIPVIRDWEGLQSLMVAFDKLSQVASKESNPRRPSAQPIFWVSVNAFYSQSTLLPPMLEPAQDWNTTSDTLAWLLAYRLKLEQVVLLKNGSQRSPTTLLKAAQSGIIDSELARLAPLTPAIQVDLKFIETN